MKHITRRWSQQPPATLPAVSVEDSLLPGFGGAHGQAAVAQLVVRRPSTRMNRLTPIVAPKHRENTRCMVCRPKARVCWVVCLLLTMISLALLFDHVLSGAEQRASWMVVLVAVGLSMAAGICGVVFRLTEQPRAVSVRRIWDFGEPPVLHTDSHR